METVRYKIVRFYFRRPDYRRTIRRGLTLHGRLGAYDPAIIEAWMRLEHGTLDHLTPKQFQREVRTALACADASTASANAALAMSFGFRG